MRFVVFILGSLASLLTLAAGGAFLLWDSFLSFAVKNFFSVTIDPAATVSMTGVTHANTGIFVALAGCYGLLGAWFALFRRGKQGAFLMLVPVLLAGALNPWLLTVTAWQGFAGLLSLAVGPLPIHPPAKDEEDEEEDEEEEE